MKKISSSSQISIEQHITTCSEDFEALRIPREYKPLDGALIDKKLNLCNLGWRECENKDKESQKKINYILTKRISNPPTGYWYHGTKKTHYNSIKIHGLDSLGIGKTENLGLMPNNQTCFSANFYDALTFARGIVYRCPMSDEHKQSFNKTSRLGWEGATPADVLECCLDRQGKIWYRVSECTLEFIENFQEELESKQQLETALSQKKHASTITHSALLDDLYKTLPDNKPQINSFYIFASKWVADLSLENIWKGVTFYLTLGAGAYLTQSQDNPITLYPDLDTAQKELKKDGRIETMQIVHFAKTDTMRIVHINAKKPIITVKKENIAGVYTYNSLIWEKDLSERVMEDSFTFTPGPDKFKEKLKKLVKTLTTEQTLASKTGEKFTGYCDIYENPTTQQASIIPLPNAWNVKSVPIEIQYYFDESLETLPLDTDTAPPSSELTDEDWVEGEETAWDEIETKEQAKSTLAECELDFNSKNFPDTYFIRNTNIFVSTHPVDAKSLTTFFKTSIFNETITERVRTVIIFQTISSHQFLAYFNPQAVKSFQQDIEPYEITKFITPKGEQKEWEKLSIQLTSPTRESVKLNVYLINLSNCGVGSWLFHNNKDFLLELAQLSLKEKILIQSSDRAGFLILVFELFKHQDIIFESSNSKALKKLSEIINRIQESLPLILNKKEVFTAIKFAKTLYSHQKTLKPSTSIHAFS